MVRNINASRNLSRKPTEAHTHTINVSTPTQATVPRHQSHTRQHSTHRGRDRDLPCAKITETEAPGQPPGAGAHPNTAAPAHWDARNKTSGV